MEEDDFEFEDEYFEDEDEDLINLGGELTEINGLNGLTLTVGDTNWRFNDGIFVQDGNDNKPLRHPDKELIYSLEDIDKVVMMLTLWIDDETIINKIEKMFKYWKDLQK